MVMQIITADSTPHLVAEFSKGYRFEKNYQFHVIVGLKTAAKKAVKEASKVGNRLCEEAKFKSLVYETIRQLENDGAKAVSSQSLTEQAQNQMHQLAPEQFQISLKEALLKGASQDHELQWRYDVTFAELTSILESPDKSRKQHSLLDEKQVTCGWIIIHEDRKFYIKAR